MTYGPCWEPSISQYNMSLNLINKASVDPSRPLPFWDKARLLFHGQITMCVNKMRWLYHAKLDPYNTTEFMDWTWSDLVLDWTNGESHLLIYTSWTFTASILLWKMSFLTDIDIYYPCCHFTAKWVLKGDLDIFARTASKYDDCRVLHLPNLRLWWVFSLSTSYSTVVPRGISPKTPLYNFLYTRYTDVLYILSRHLPLWSENEQFSDCATLYQ